MEKKLNGEKVTQRINKCQKMISTIQYFEQMNKMMQ